MEITLSLYEVSFWGAIFFTAFGALLGLMGVWIREFWESETCVKLLITDLIFAGTSIIVAAVTKFLS